MRNAYNGHHLSSNGHELRYEYQEKQKEKRRLEYDDDEKHNEHDNDNRIWLSDHIIYCFDRKFSHHYIECCLFVSLLKSSYPYSTHTDNGNWDNVNLSEYRFLRLKKNEYYLSIEPEDICPSGTECTCHSCHRLHYISNEDMCSQMRACSDVLCHQIHYVSGERLCDRIISLLSVKRVSLISFMRCYSLKYGEFMAFEYELTELKRVLTEYSNMNSVRLWRITWDDYIEFEFVSILNELCLNHIESQCNFNPSYLCPYLHPARLVFASLQLPLDTRGKQMNNHNYTKQIHYPLLRSSKSIKSELEMKYKSKMYEMRINPPHFLHFADQLIDCFGRNFSSLNWMKLSLLKKKLRQGFALARVQLSNYRFLRSKLVGDCKYIGLKILNDDLCPMGLYCSWLGCCRIHHISHEEIVYSDSDSDSDADDTCLRMHSQQRFIDRMMSILISVNNNNNNNNKFWIDDFLLIYGEYYGALELQLQLDGVVSLATLLNEYGKYYIVNAENGDTEYIQLWCCSYDDEMSCLYLSCDVLRKREILCADYMYTQTCSYVPLSLCPYIHCDVRLVKKHDLNGHALRIAHAHKQRYRPLSRSIIEIKQYIESVKQYIESVSSSSSSSSSIESSFEKKWAQHLQQYDGLHDMHRAFSYLRMEWRVSHLEHLELIDSLFTICVCDYQLSIVDICIAGTRKNVALKYLIIGRNHEETLLNLWRIFGRKSNNTREWCYNRIICMRMSNSESKHVLFELQGMNPFITSCMARKWFESKFDLSCLKYCDATTQYLYSRNSCATSHALVFVFNDDINIPNGKKGIVFKKSSSAMSVPWIHSANIELECEYHIPKQNCYFADRILDCCLRKFNIGTSYFDLEYFMKLRYDSKDIFWHKYRFPQTDSCGYCFMNIQPDDICPFGDECKWLRCCRLHHICGDEICGENENCDNSQCFKLHLHHQRLVDRIASVLLYEYNNYMANKCIADSYIFLGKFLVIYQMLYKVNFESLLYEMNLPKMKQQFPWRFADVSVFLIEYGRYALVNEYKQLWNVQMYGNDHTPHITMNPVIVDLVCYDHMASSDGCQYAPHYQCPYLHLDKTFVHLQCQCRETACSKYHIAMSSLKKAPKQKYKPLLRDIDDIRECISNMRNIQLVQCDDEDEKHMIAWNKTLCNEMKNITQFDHSFRFVNIECKMEKKKKNEIKFIHEIYKLAQANWKIPIVDIHINSTKKIIALMYRVISASLWFEFRAMFFNYDIDKVVWCFNRIIKLRMNEMNLDDGLYIIFEFEPINAFINICTMKQWFQHKFNPSSSFLSYIDGVTQFIKLHESSSSSSNIINANVYCANNGDEKKLLLAHNNKNKIFGGKVAINIVSSTSNEENYPHRKRKLYHHSPPDTISILLKKYEKYQKEKYQKETRIVSPAAQTTIVSDKRKKVFGNWAYLKTSAPISVHEFQHINDDIDSNKHDDNEKNEKDESNITAYDFFFNVNSNC